MQSSKYALIAVATACANSFAAADPGDIYIEGVAGTFADDFDVFDENDYALLGVRAGYSFNDFFAVEGEYSGGTNSHETSYAFNRFPDRATVLGTSEVKLDALYGIYGKASYPFAGRFAVHARAGFAESEFDYSSTVLIPESGTPSVSNATNSKTYFSYGVGGTIDVSDRIYARADVTGYSEEMFDEIYSATVSVGVRF